MVIGDDNTASAKFKTSRSWDNLSPPLSAWLRNAMGSLGYARMTPVQANTIPLFLGYKDVVVEVNIPFINCSFMTNKFLK